jgi:F-type H+-transporting ATPase subunit b
VKKFLDDRAAGIEEDIDKVRLKGEEAEQLKKRYEQMIVDIEKEREEILRQAHNTATERADQLLMDARREADAVYNRAIAEIETERNKSMHETRIQIIEIATMMAERFVEVSMDRETQDKFIDKAFTGWEGY